MRWPVLLLVMLPACTEIEEVTTEDVFRMDVTCSLETADCQPVADNRTPLYVRLCTAAEGTHRDQVPTTVRLSNGRWLVTEPAQMTVLPLDIAATDCDQERYVTRPFLPGSTPGLLQVTAEVGSFQITQDILLVAADIDAVELRPAVFDLASTDTIGITALVYGARNGFASDGTRVRFEAVNPEPADGFVTIFPASVLMNSDGTAQATLQTDSSITAVTVRATAIPPQADGVAPPAVSGELRMQALP